jgi:protein-tyrosine phosphatase
VTAPVPRREAFRLLFVCTGNICRSPLAEQLLRRDLGGHPDVVVASAGLRAMAGSPMDAHPTEISRRLGGDPAGAVGKQLHDRFVDGADLLLVMTVAQLGELTRDFPRATRKAFTLRQFAELVELLEPLPSAAETVPTQLRELVARASQQRFRAGATDPDIRDPYKQSAELHEEVGAAIDQAVRTVSQRLRHEIAVVPTL